MTAALAAYDGGTSSSADVVAALAAGRLLVAVVAVLDEAGGSDGIRTDKASHMATVTTTGRDGRRGLLAFTCLDSMRRWNPDARPVPVPTRGVAQAALAEGADAVVVDLAGPVVFAIDTEDLRVLASGSGDRGQPVGHPPGPARGGILPD
ncbi:MAG: SseB family protein [Jiangellaceae bacterium]